MSERGAVLADRIAILRDQVLETAERGEDHPLGAEIFDAVVRSLAVRDATDPGLDLALHDALSRRLAWGDDELAVLADTEAVCQRLLDATRRALDAPTEEVVAEAVTDVGCAAARIVAMAAVGRAGRERAALLREQGALARLERALERQRAELARFGRRE
jgi:hypothetical protein